MHYDKQDLHIMDLYNTICGLSYKGDIRMNMKMENPNKIKNIVIGSLEGLEFIYRPKL